MIRLNQTDYSKPQTKAKLHCANWVNGNCLGICFVKTNEDLEGYDVGHIIDKKYAGKPCVVETGDECPYFSEIVKKGIPEIKSIRGRK